MATALRLVSTLDMPKEDWLQYRRQGIGGSDVSALFGLSKYKSAMEVYLEKMGQLPELEDNPRMKAGRMLEPLIADWFTEETGIKVHKRNAILQHADYPFMLANIDRWVYGKNEGLEIKNTSEYSRGDWSGNTAPTEYLLQCNHYMAITGAERWHLAVLIGGWDLQLRTIERDEDIIKMLIDKETDFWHNNVLAKVVPAVSAIDTDMLSRMYPDSKPTTTVDLDDGQLIEDFILARKVVAEAENRLELAKNKIKVVMQDNEVALFGGTPVFNWKCNKKNVRSFRFVGEE